MAFGGDLPMFGRKAELATLRAAAAAAGRGEPAGVVLVGEAGVGKTRLAAEIARELERDGAVVVTSHGVQLAGGELPYAGIGELVRGLVRTVGVPEVTKAAGRDLRSLGAFDRAFGADRVPDRSEVTAALLAAVEGLGRRRTVLWVVDDLQWLDAASRDLVRYLVRVVDQTRLLMVLTLREEPDSREDGSDLLVDLARAPGLTTLAVRPLADAAVDAQARSLSGRVLDAVELERIRRLSDGLPFFVEELVAAEGRTPSTLRKAVAMTTRELTDDTRLLLRATALEESLARPDLVARVAGLTEDDVAAAIAEARGHDILRLDRDRDVLRFRHALLREAVDDEMLAGDRRVLHRRWATTLDDAAGEPGAPASLVVARARHWHLAGDPAEAFPHVLAAARYVDTSEDQAAQALWWGRVLDSWPQDHDDELTRDWALYHLVLALVGVGDPEQALSVLRRELVRPAGGGDVRRLWLQLTHRHLAKFTRDWSDAPEPPTDPDEVFAWLRTVGPDFRVNAALHFLLHEWDGSRPDLYLPLCDELARRGESEGDMDTWYLGVRHRGWWQQGQGDFEGQLETVRAAREVVLTRMPGRRLEAEWDWCWGLEEAGRYEEASMAAEQAVARVEEPRAALHLWTILVLCTAAAHAALGLWGTARGWLGRLDGHEAADPGRGVRALAVRLSGELAARTGDVAAAEQGLATISTETEVASAPWTRLGVAALTAEIALVTDDRPRAEAVLRSLDEVGHAIGTPDETAQLVLSVSRLSSTASDGMLSGALAVGARLLPPGGPVPTAVRAELAEHERRLTGSDTGLGWHSVADGWRAFGRVYDVAWCCYLQGQAALREGDRAQATSALAEAWLIAVRLGAQPLQERVGACARRARIALEGASTDTVGSLTPRETEVLRLVARGRTNAQIADELVISAKTASVHVSRILSKLGASNRTEAAAVARRLGVD